MEAAIAVDNNADTHEAAHERGHELPFIRKYIFSTDHKVIAKQFLLSSLFFLFVGGFFVLLIRWQLAMPGRPIPIIGSILPSTWAENGVMLSSFYLQALTMHGSIMIFLVIIPLAVGFFGNLCIPLMIGADDMALPKLNMFSYWMLPPASIIIMMGFWAQGGGAAAGWTSYPPLAVTGGAGQTCWLIGVFLLGFSSIMGSVNYIATVLNKRAKGMKMLDMPLTIWTIFFTAVLIVLGTPVLASAISMQFFDQFFHSSFFMPDNLIYSKEGLKFMGGGQPILFQHLFWFYSHPAVYIMIVPLMGVVSDVLSVHSRKPVYGYKAMVFATMGIVSLGFIVWGHHMFQSGMNPLLGTSFMLSTIVIAVPSSIKTFNWLGTMWRGNIRFTAANMNAIGFVATFIIGGLSGVFMASAPVDIYIHDTYFIVAHIHYVLFGGTLFGIFAGIYHWFPKLFGKMLNESLGRKHFYWTFICFNLTFYPMHILGVAGHMRRIYDPTVYDFLKPLQPMNQFITIFAFLLGFSQLILVANIIYSLKWGKKAPRNPWNANSLEWAAPSPPPHGNFDSDIRVYRGPYEYSLPGSNLDYAPQWIADPEKTDETTLPHAMPQRELN